MLAGDLFGELLHRRVEDNFEARELGSGRQPSGFLPGLRRDRCPGHRMDGIALSIRQETRERDRAGFDFRDVEDPLVEAAEAGGPHGNVSVHNCRRNVVRDSNEEAVFQKLVKLKICGGLAGESTHDELGHRSERIVFRGELLHAIDVNQ